MSERAAAPFEITGSTVGMLRDGTALRIESRPGPPSRVDGLSLGVVTMTRNAPHGGEVHPDGDELLVLLSGRIAVVLEEADGERTVELAPGQALIVPRGVWHRVVLLEESRLVHATPGPGGDHRPLAGAVAP